MRSTFPLFATLVAFPAFAGEPDLSSPPATVRSYLAAIKANDIEAAKRCWTIDDSNASGALDVVAGMWVASRKLVAVTQAKFGEPGLKHLGRWNRQTCSDKAIDLTLERLASAETKELKNAARVTIPWQAGDPSTAFCYMKAPLILLKLEGQWKLDANVFTGVEKAGEMFGPKSIWSACRDEMNVMNELISAIEKGKIIDVAGFEQELNARAGVLKAKYEKKDLRQLWK
jgi:hypothetical protein